MARPTAAARPGPGPRSSRRSGRPGSWGCTMARPPSGRSTNPAGRGTSNGSRPASTSTTSRSSSPTTASSAAPAAGLCGARTTQRRPSASITTAASVPLVGWRGRRTATVASAARASGVRVTRSTVGVGSGPGITQPTRVSGGVPLPGCADARSPTVVDVQILPLARSVVAPSAHRRSDPALLSRAAREPATWLVLLHDGRIATVGEGDGVALDLRRPADLAGWPEDTAADSGLWLFLGEHAGETFLALLV